MISDETTKYASMKQVRDIVSKIVFNWRQHLGTNIVIVESEPSFSSDFAEKGKKEVKEVEEKMARTK